MNKIVESEINIEKQEFLSGQMFVHLGNKHLIFSHQIGRCMELQKLLELPLRNKCGQLGRYILKTNWRPTLIRAKTGPLFSLGLLWPSVTPMFSTIFVSPRFQAFHSCMFPSFFTPAVMSDINLICSFLLC